MPFVVKNDADPDLGDMMMGGMGGGMMGGGMF